MFGLFKKKKVNLKSINPQELDAKIKELEEYINNFNMWSAAPSEESMNRMCDDEMWDGYQLSIDVDAVAAMIKEKGINPISLFTSTCIKYIQIDHEREPVPVSLREDGTFGVSDEMKRYMKKKESNPIIIIRSEFLPPLVINGNHRIAVAHKKGQKKIEGYVVEIEDCKEAMLQECLPVYEAYKEWYRLKVERAAV